MFPRSRRSPQAVFPLAACLLLAVGSGCGGKPAWFRGETPGPLLESVKVSELRPGGYCEIEMFVPPTSPDGSFHCFKGNVKEINHDEVVLSDVLEVSYMEYGIELRTATAHQQKRALVHVPLAGVQRSGPFRRPRTMRPRAPPRSRRRIRPPSSCLPPAQQPLPPPQCGIFVRDRRTREVRLLQSFFVAASAGNSGKLRCDPGQRRAR